MREYYARRTTFGSRKEAQVDIDLSYFQKYYADASPREIICMAHQQFGPKLVMSSHCSTDSACLLHMTNSMLAGIPVIYIEDPDTADFAKVLKATLSINLKVYWPCDPPDKLKELQEAMRKLGAVAVLQGIRAYQNKERASRQVIELGEDGIYRVNPLLRQSPEYIRRYMYAHELLYHPSAPRSLTKDNCELQGYKTVPVS